MRFNLILSLALLAEATSAVAAFRASPPLQAPIMKMAQTEMLFAPHEDAEVIGDGVPAAGLVPALRWSALFVKCHWLTHHRRRAAMTDVMGGEVELDPRTMLFVPAETGSEKETFFATTLTRPPKKTMPKKTDWDAYRLSKLEPLQKKQWEGWERVWQKGLEDHEKELEKLSQANKIYQEQQYEQHHHPVHVSHSRHERAGYLDTLAINKEEHHDNAPRGYLDTLSIGKENTWDAYKHALDDAGPSPTPREDDDHVPKLALEAYLQNHPSVSKELHALVEHVSTVEELKELDEKSRDYERAVTKEMLMPKPAEEISGVVDN